MIVRSDSIDIAGVRIRITSYNVCYTKLLRTQEELANKVGTTKNYISRIENDASDIRLSTLMRIIREGLGGHLKLSLEM